MEPAVQPRGRSTQIGKYTNSTPQKRKVLWFPPPWVTAASECNQRHTGPALSPRDQGRPTTIPSLLNEASSWPGDKNFPTLSQFTMAGDGNSATTWGYQRTTAYFTYSGSSGFSSFAAKE